MNIKNNCMVTLSLIVIELRVVQINADKIILPLGCISSSINKNNINNINENITEKAKLITLNLKIHTRKKQSNPPATFNAPSSENQLQTLNFKFQDIQDDVAKLKAQVNDFQISARLGSLEATSQQLHTTLDDVIRKVSSQEYNLESFIETNRKKTQAYILQELDNLKQTFEAEKKNSKVLRAEVIDDIKSRDFKSAARMLGNLDTELEKHINFIVHEVYNNQAGNFDLILLFGDSRDINKTASLAVYQALAFEMESNGHNDYLKIVKILKNLNKINDIEPILPGSPKLEGKLIDTVSKKIEEELLKAISSNNYDTISEIFKNILEQNSKVFESIMDESFQEIVDEIDLEKLINILTSNKFSASHSIWLLSGVFTKLQIRQDTDYKIIITIAYALKKALDNSTVDKDSRIKGEILRDDLPESVANLAFAKRVCIRNVDRNEYLYAGSDEFKYDKNRRRVFTGTTGERVGQGNWILEQKEDVYHIKNDDHHEYLYNAWNGDKNNKYVFTWRENIDSNQFNWVFEPKENYVYIKNTNSNAYMFAADDLYKNDFRNVYTLDSASNEKIPGSKVNASLWSIQNCDN